jgi:PII-like signaling protein
MEVPMPAGSQLTLYTSRKHKKGHKSAVSWIIDAARAQGVFGITVLEGYEGLDAHGKLHASHFFDLADEPAVVLIVADEPSIDALLVTLEQGGIELFYTRSAIDYGRLGGS